MTKSVTTKFYRKSRILQNYISDNSDLFWFGISLLGAFLLGVFSILIVAALYILLGGDASSIPGGWKSLAALFISLAVEIWAVIKKLYSPQGEITKSLSESGNKPLEDLDSSGNTIISTDLILPRHNRSLKVEINESKIGAEAMGVPNDVIFPKAKETR